MTKRSAPWPMYVPEGTKNVGTARVRDDSVLPQMTHAQREIYKRTGNPPQSSALDDPLDPFGKTIASCAARFEPSRELMLHMQSKKPPKYRNSKCEHNGIKFDSEKERSRWFHLVQLQAAGRIRELRLQVPYVLTARKQRDDGTWERASKYVADFVYFDVDAGKEVVEDVKSIATRKNRTYIQKRKQMLAVHNISVKEI
ncbi:DUF1064 domain-containing protein [Caballeronia sp. GAFFF2]|uniref:DUF1064 domain-containing protein n=1 Tax=Caballeronia sp. GAFFF2 TaxID=2921741 RepID=UPI002027D79D|nr:DUF1064 domain-containing protein [Caballeronia sp. GAFFF2]